MMRMRVLMVLARTGAGAGIVDDGLDGGVVDGLATSGLWEGWLSIGGLGY